MNRQAAGDANVSVADWRLRCFGVCLLLLGSLAPRAVLAGPLHDLRVHELPAPRPDTLTMRRVQQVENPTPPPETAGGGTVTAESLTEYHPLPRDRRELEERVIARVSAGFQLDAGSLSGDLMRTGQDVEAVRDPNGDALRQTRQYLMGDAVLGSRGVLMPSLHTYLLSRYRLEPDGASRFAVVNDAFDRRGAQDFVIRAGYAEIDGVGDGALRSLNARAGRLFRGGSAMYVTNFDGAQAGWKSDAFTVDGYFGRRVSLYSLDTPGLVGGAGVVFRGAEVGPVPVDATVDYNFFGGVDDPLGAAVSRHALSLLTRLTLGDSRVYLRGRVVDRGDGFGLGRLGVRLRQPVGARLLLVADLEERFEGELAYDLTSAESTDVVDAGRLPALGLPPPLDSTLVGARADLMITRALEAYLFGRASLVHGDAESHFQNSWQELGGALAATQGKVSASGQLKLRRYELDDTANQVGDLFADTSGSGVSQFAELAGEARYRFADRKGSAAASAYYRVYEYRGPYTEIDADGRGGARLEGDYWATKMIRVAASGEVAQPSPTLSRELSALTSVRLLAEARF